MPPHHFANVRIMLRNWRLRYKMFLEKEGTMSEIEAFSHEDCLFGKWLYSKGMFEYGKTSQMKIVDNVHVRLHQTARRIYYFKKSGDTVNFKREMKRLEEQFKQIFSQLDVLNEKLQKKS